MIRIMILGDQTDEINRGKSNRTLWTAVADLRDQKGDLDITLGCLAEDKGINALAYRLAKLKCYAYEVCSLLTDDVQKEIPAVSRFRFKDEGAFLNHLASFDNVIRIGGTQEHKNYCKWFSEQKAPNMVLEVELS